MKNQSIRLLSTVGGILLHFCALAQDDAPLYPVNDRKVGYLGYYLEDGTNVVPPQFCSASYLIEDRYYIVSRAEHEYEPDGRRKESHVPHTERYGLLNRAGRFIIGFESGYDFISPKDGVIEVFKNNKCGIVNAKNEVIIPLEYQELTVVNKNSLIAKKGEKIGVIDLQNKTIIPFIYDQIYGFETKSPEGQLLSIVKIGNNTGVINIHNQYILALGDLDIVGITPVSVAVRVGNKYGLMDYKRKMMLPAIYTEFYQIEQELQFEKADERHYYSFDGKLLRKEKIEVQVKSSK